jgi:hypothetical protein
MGQRFLTRYGLVLLRHGCDGESEAGGIRPWVKMGC